MRRGKATANAAFGNAASVLVGDFIYTRAFQMMTQLGSLKILEVMSEAVNVIAEGEVLQLMNVNDPDITEENYMRVIYSKTARLFEAASQCAGLLADCTAEEERALQDYGRYLGTAFQLIDDLLDYSSDGERLGKNVGDDLNEGKPTLPLLRHAPWHTRSISDDPRCDRARQRPPSTGCCAGNDGDLRFAGMDAEACRRRS